MSSDERAISQLIADMTPAEKIGQMTQVSNESISPAEVADHFIGSVLSGGNGNPRPNTPSVWVDMVGSFAEAAAGTRLGIPLLYGVDAVHGHSNVGGATVFPHNIGLGAAGDEDLVRRIGRATAAEMLATGVRWTFAPTLAVPQDIRWGRTYEGYARDPELTSALGAALVRGLQGSEGGRPAVLACARPFRRHHPGRESQPSVVGAPSALHLPGRSPRGLRCPHRFRPSRGSVTCRGRRRLEGRLRAVRQPPAPPP